jgi:hypothetical protein
MAATCNIKVCTGTNAATESSGDAANLNFMATDAYDSSGSSYQSNPIVVPGSGNAYSYERWFRAEFTGTFNAITNVKYYKSAGTLSDAALIINAGESASGVTPVVTASSIATGAVPTSSGSAIDITPSGGIDTSGDETDYGVMQLVVPYTVVTPGDIGSQTITLMYDEA